MECKHHKNRKLEYYSKELKKTLCSNCVYELPDLDRETLSDGYALCRNLRERWMRLLDNATYMPCEHI